MVHAEQVEQAMTAQIGELIFYGGEEHSMCEEPLSMYFRLRGEEPRFALTSTALWRGYLGTWEVLDDRLYLVGLDATLEDGGEADLETIFPGFPTRVFAHWYSGTIRIPQGKLLDYVHMGYESVYERDLLLSFDKGMLAGTEVKVNGVSESETAPEGYSIGAMTTFPPPEKKEEQD